MSYKAKDFIDAIPGTGGIIAHIARKVGCKWDTAKKYITEHPTVKQAYDNECETNLDAAESVILQGIKKKNSKDAQYYLSKKGVRRGYGEVRRNQNVNIDITQLSNDQLERLAKGEDPINVISNPS